MKYATILGVLFGFLLAVGALWAGVTGFLIVGVLCGVGGLIGAHVEGLIDLRAVFSSGHRGRG
ncbi:hypothetical protein [Corynebacterium terpenotabidum]|uniref:Uncharacterized protein n=1 Tax=Corynebacterium terpenotabidum Y-11 TaxID=1200352 RepID=S4XGA7_9CORY|nr:hypothetical protein [Corynebacterium terpenotabidum]AGP31614.1 hypothetical protein A606_09875 [Corynebacterium terpenotabidum Y-11]